MAIALESQETAITTNTTTTVITAASGASDERRCKVGMLVIRNKGGSTNTITIQKDVGGTNYEMMEVVLDATDGYDWVNPFEIILTGTSAKLEIVTSSTSAIDVVAGFVEKT